MTLIIIGSLRTPNLYFHCRCLSTIPDLCIQHLYISMWHLKHILSQIKLTRVFLLPSYAPICPLSEWHHPLSPNYTGQKLDICSHSVSHPISTEFCHLKISSSHMLNDSIPFSALIKASFALCLDSSVGLLTEFFSFYLPASNENASVLPNLKVVKSMILLSYWKEENQTHC